MPCRTLVQALTTFWIHSISLSYNGRSGCVPASSKNAGSVGNLCVGRRFVLVVVPGKQAEIRLELMIPDFRYRYVRYGFIF